jgi:hypothetical protein
MQLGGAGADQSPMDMDTSALLVFAERAARGAAIYLPARGNLNYDGVTPVAKPGIFRTQPAFPLVITDSPLEEEGFEPSVPLTG